MKVQKYHIGDNGPAPCKAKFRACKFEVEGTQAEVNAVWEKQLEAEFADLTLEGVSRDSPKISLITKDSDIDSKDASNDESRNLDESLNQSEIQARIALGKKSNYIPNVNSDAEYSEDDQNLAMKLALSNLSEFSYMPIRSRDFDWETDGTSQVARYTLEDGSVGYFKSFEDNSQAEDFFNDYGTTSLGAGINEVNSYRMAQAFGGEYTNLVPETVIREIEGKLGTLQREVAESRIRVKYEDSLELQDDYRRAVIFDFVIGNLDRHIGNFLYGESEVEYGRPRIKLIDNSFSFSVSSDRASINESLFANNFGPNGDDDVDDYKLTKDERRITPEEISELRSVRKNVEGWISSKTMDSVLGDSTIKRIDFLIEDGRLGYFNEYYYGKLDDLDDY